MLFTTTNLVSKDEIDSINNFFETFDTEVNTVSPKEALQQNAVSKYITSLANNAYAKSVEDIANTNVGNKVVRKRNLQQIMRESFFYGANRFGNNFIA